MRRIIVVVALLAVVGIAGFLYLFKREAVMELVDSSRGYGKAKTPQECVDNFKKAIKERKYDKAAKYCTKEYAEQLTRSSEAAADLGGAIDDLNFRLKQSSVGTSEIYLMLFYSDPLPPQLTVTLKSTGEKDATATLGVSEPSLLTTNPGSWPIDTRFSKALYAFLPGEVRLVKEGDAWKIDFPVVPAQRVQVDTLIANYMDYLNAYKKMSQELRIENTTKAEVEPRFRELLTDAVNAKK